MCKEKREVKVMRVKYWNNRERQTSEPFYRLYDAVEFMRLKERQGYTTVLIESRL